MSTVNLVAEVPAHWVSIVRPFLQRADEFQAREPLVSYYLRTHVAFLCMQKRTKEDKEGTKFLMKLLDALEEDKKSIGGQLDGVDGRTVLTKIALMLFARADDEERSGNASMSIVRIFYTAAVLFEATEQFTDDGKMDTMAAEKCKYAKYTAARMKKALDSNQPYVSKNAIEAPLNDAAGAPGSLSTAAPSAYMPKQPSGTYATPPQPQPPQSLEPMGSGGGAGGGGGGDGEGCPPPYTQSTRANHGPGPSAPPPSGHGGSAAGPAGYSPPPMQPARPAAPPQPQPSYTPPATGGGGGHAPTPDDMIDAQKYARQAVSALQFYDHNTARIQLITALNILDGKMKK